MCCLCEAWTIEEVDVAEPWEALKDEVLAALKESAAGFSGDLKASAQAFLRDQAVAIAREKWRQLNASTDEEKAIAESNLRHLQGQVGAEIARLQIAATQQAGALLERVLSTAVGVLVRVGPKIFGA